MKSLRQLIEKDWVIDMVGEDWHAINHTLRLEYYGTTFYSVVKIISKFH